MNNSIFNVNEGEKISTEQLFKIEVALQDGERLIGAIKELQDFSPFRIFVNTMINPAVEVAKKKIELDVKELKNDHSGLFRNRILENQGMLIAFRKISDLEGLSKELRSQADKLREILKKHG